MGYGILGLIEDNTCSLCTMACYLKLLRCYSNSLLAISCFQLCALDFLTQNLQLQGSFLSLTTFLSRKTCLHSDYHNYCNYPSCTKLSCGMAATQEIGKVDEIDK